MVYERMIENPVAQYRLLADFMGISPLLTDEDIAEIASETTATALARKEAEGKLLGKTKVSKFNPTQKVKSYKKTVRMSGSLSRYLVSSLEPIFQTQLNFAVVGTNTGC